MTLQYRIRSKFEDQLWAHRISLCEAMLTKSLDGWCASHGVFPTDEVVAATLFLLSPQRFLYEWSPSGLWDRLRATMKMPEAEYQSAWPRRSSDDANTLIASLKSSLTTAVEIWTAHGIVALSVQSVTKALVAEIVRQRYVIIHHSESTLRDANHWGI
jgi:hypothetical protein